MLVIRDILFYRRQYFIDKVKKPLLKAITTLAKRYPDPSPEDVVFEQSRIRIAAKEYIKQNLISNRTELVDLAMRVFIDECEHDGFYEFLHDEYISFLLAHGWKPNKQRRFPMWRYWKGQLSKSYQIETNPEWKEMQDAAL